MSNAAGSSWSVEKRSKKSNMSSVCTCNDPFAMNPCPKHPDTSCLTNFPMSSTLGRTSSMREETKKGFGSTPPCECGLRYMSQQKLEQNHHQVSI